MPSLSRFADGEAGQVVIKTTQPSGQQNGDHWSDTSQSPPQLKVYDGSDYQNVGKQSFAGASVVTHSETIGDYTTPSSAVSSSTSYSPNSVNDPDTVWIPSDIVKARVNTTNDNIDFDFEDNLGSNSAIYYDFGSARSDTDWVLRFKINFTSIDDNSRTWFGLSSVIGNQATAQDFIGLLVHRFTDAKWKTADSDGASLPTAGDNQSTSNISTSTNYWIQITRLTATTYEIKIYSDAYTTLIETVAGTCASTTASLRYIVFCNRNDFDSTNKQVGIIDDVAFQNAVTTFTTADFSDSFTTNSASKSIDGNTSTYSETHQETNPNIYYDAGSSKKFFALAINPKSTTTETEIKVRVSDDTTFTDGETVRTILVSALTMGSWNYIRFNLNIGRYIQVYGSSGSSKRLALNEVKYLTKTDDQIWEDLGLLEISETDTSIGLNGV